MKYDESKRIEFTKRERTSPKSALNDILRKLISSKKVYYPFDRVKPSEYTYAAVLECPDHIMDAQLTSERYAAANETANEFLENFASVLQAHPALEDFDSAVISYSIVLEGQQKVHIGLDHAFEYDDGQNFRVLLFSDDKFYHSDDGSYCEDELMCSAEQLEELRKKCKCREFRFLLTVQFI